MDMAILREVKKQAKRKAGGARPMTPWKAIAGVLFELKAPAGSSDAPFAADALGANLFSRTLDIPNRFNALYGQNC